MSSAETPGPDHAAPTQAADKVESKLVVSTVLATLLYGVLQVISDNTAVLDFLPAWARGIVLAILPGLLAFAAGWRVPSNRV